MKMIKIMAVLIITAALFSSCELNGPEAYGTLVINSSGNSARVIGVIDEASDDAFKALQNDISYEFECVNEKTGNITTKAYNLNSPENVVIQLVPGDWAVWVKIIQDVKKEGGETLGKGVIGSKQYNDGKPVTIRAGQTIILGGLNVSTSPYGKAIAHYVNDADFKNDGYKEADNANWSKASTININRYVYPLGGDGQPTGSKTPLINNPYGRTVPTGTADILWDETYLYVRVIVKDANVDLNDNKTSVQPFNSNSVEIFYTASGTIGYQYRITCKGTKTYHTTGSGGDAKPANIEENDFMQDKIDSTSYAVIARIEHGVNTTDKKTIGVDLQINGIHQADGYRSSIAVWYDGQVFQTPGAYKNSLALVD